MCNIMLNITERGKQFKPMIGKIQLVNPRQNQISNSQSFRKLLVFRQSLRKRKTMKHSKTDHNKLVQSRRLTQRIRKAASGLHVCAIALASFFLSLRQRNVHCLRPSKLTGPTETKSCRKLGICAPVILYRFRA